MSFFRFIVPRSDVDSVVQRKGWHIWPVRIVVGFVILFLLLAFLLPGSFRSAGEAAHRMNCGNNLRQLGTALLDYEKVYHSLPPAFAIDAEGRPMHSWRTLILPFLDAKGLMRHGNSTFCRAKNLTQNSQENSLDSS